MKVAIEIDYKSVYGGFAHKIYDMDINMAYAKCSRIAALSEKAHCVNLYKRTKGNTYKHIARFFPNGNIETDYQMNPEQEFCA